jgi:hypothetical protein
MEVMGPRVAIRSMVVAIAILIALLIVWPDQKMRSRDIGCAKVSPGRGKELCQSLSESMEWTWMGHAIISPGWRVTWNTLRRVYCRDKTSASDLPVLESLKMGSDWRLDDAADDLIRLVGGRAEPENSIFNPANPQYILIGGCPGSTTLP